MADKNVKFIADINVLDGNNNVVKISDTKMKIRIALPEDLKGYDKYEVVYIVNDEIKETLPATVENGYIVFETNHLSQYGIIATNTGNGTTSPQTGDTTSPQTGDTTSPKTGKTTSLKTGDTTSPKTSDTTSPKTGDTSNIVLWAALLFISCGALAGTLVIDKKKKTMK